jgi:hypothetical protein
MAEKVKGEERVTVNVQELAKITPNWRRRIISIGRAAGAAGHRVLYL